MINLRIEYLDENLNWVDVPGVYAGSVNIKTGFQDDMFFERVAQSGEMSFVCWDKNQWHSSQDRTGTRVRAIVEYGQDKECVFDGKITDSKWADFANYSEINYSVKDLMFFLGEKKLGLFPLYKNIRADEYIKKITGDIGFDSYDLELGNAVLPFAGELIYREKSVIEELVQIANTINAFFFLRYSNNGVIFAGRTLNGIFETSLGKVQKSISYCGTLETESGLALESEGGIPLNLNELEGFVFGGGDIPALMEIKNIDIINSVTVKGYTRKKLNNYVPVFSLPSQVSVPANSEIWIDANYSVDGVSEIVSCFDFRGAGNYGESVFGNYYRFSLPQSDYSANTQEDGNGINVSSYVSVDVFPSQRDARIRINNSYSKTVFVITLKVYGDPVIIANDNDYIFSNEESVKKYGVLSKEIVLAYDTNAENSSVLGNFPVIHYGFPFRYVKKVTIEGINTKNIMSIMTVGVGEIVKYNSRSAEVTTGQIYSIEYDINPSGFVRAVFYVCPRLTTSGEIYLVNNDGSLVEYLYSGYIQDYSFLNPEAMRLYIRLYISPSSDIENILQIAGGAKLSVSWGGIFEQKLIVSLVHGGEGSVYTAIFKTNVISSGWHDVIIYTSTVAPLPPINILVDGVPNISSTNSYSETENYLPKPNSIIVTTKDVKIQRITAWNGTFAEMDFSKAEIDLAYTINDALANKYKTGTLIFDGIRGIPLKLTYLRTF